MDGDLQPILDKTELVLLELRELAQTGPRFRIVHRFRNPTGCQCQDGEEIAAIYLMHRGNGVLVRLPLALRLVFDYLAHHRHLPQSSGQISAGMRVLPFYAKHGCNAGPSNRQTRKISRSAVKEYVNRIRTALDATFRESRMALKPGEVLVSLDTVSNEVGYRLRATIEWVHIEDLP